MTDEEVLAILDKILKPLGTATKHYMPMSKAEAIKVMREVMETLRKAAP